MVISRSGEDAVDVTLDNVSYLRVPILATLTTDFRYEFSLGFDLSLREGAFWLQSLQNK